MEIKVNNPHMTQLDNGLWRLEEDLIVDLGWFKHKVPAGFVSDGSSVPRLLRWAFKTDQNMIASFVHDDLYRSRIYSRLVSDVVFYEILAAQKEKTSYWQSLAALVVLQAGGWLAWHRWI